MSPNNRPQDLNSFIGQEKIVKTIEVMIQACKHRDKVMDHLLFVGPPGLGKTSLAWILAKQLGSQCHIVSAPALSKKGDLVAVLSMLQDRDVLFIDEIHRLTISLEEVLYQAMEDFRLDIMLGQGQQGKLLNLTLPSFTLIGATTKIGLLSAPFRDRFGLTLNFQYYGPQELESILDNDLKENSVKLTSLAKHEILRRSRGTPRVAKHLLQRVLDYASAYKKEELNEKNIQEVFHWIGVDEHGLHDIDRKILITLQKHFNGGPVGISTLSAAISETQRSVEEIYEPYLLKKGLIARTPRGRTLTENAKKLIEGLHNERENT